MLSDKYTKSECIYNDGTNGSEDRLGVGSAAVWGDVVRMEALPPESSIYTAEVFFVGLALQMIKGSKKSVWIYTRR